jgi:hypothetical protein
MQHNSAELSKRSWTKQALAALAVILLAAVPALGLTTLGPEFFPSAPALADNLQTAGVSNGPLTFDAPMVKVQKSRPADVQNALGGEEGLLFTDWRFTASATLPDFSFATISDLYEDDPAGFAILSFQYFYVLQNQKHWTKQQRLLAYFILFAEYNALVSKVQAMSPDDE